MIRISNIKIYEDLTNEDILKKTISKYKIKNTDVLKWNISKKSIDARKKDDVHYNFAIDLELKNENYYIGKYKNISKVKEVNFPKININISLKNRPVIIGAGPAGLFSALTFIRHGIKPIVIEQGESVENRKKSVDVFRKTGKLNTSSNVQFGEGGAGTFSDGKLTTGINSPYCKKVLEEFVEFGAPEEILYLSKPHIGTDNLINIIKNMREYMIQKGATFLFNTKVIDFNIKNNKITSIITQKTNNTNDKNNISNTNENTSIINTVDYNNNGINEIYCDFVVLAIGHSSRDTFEKLYEKNFIMESKNFSVGVRIEHLQSWINEAQYGKNPKLKLPPADYKLAYHSPNGRSCYTFCMCPGGVVIASSSEPNTIVTNGMSNFLRNETNSNSALLVNVTPDDFSSTSPLAGIYFQKELEEKAFILGGSNYNAPIQRTQDFIENRKSTFIGTVKPSYLPNTTLSNLNDILPNFISSTLKEGIRYFGQKLKNFDNPDGILTGLETRSSSPVRILRDENLVSNIQGVYPCGEGAGYAGGIMSAAVDGIKCAISVLKANN